MKNVNLVLAMTLALCSCSKVEESGFEKSLVRLEVEVGNDVHSRTSTGDDGKTIFVDKDCIGLFMKENNTASVWTYDGSTWTANTEVTWENKFDKFEFLAYYPCTSDNVSRDGIMMPDLSSQTGKLSDIGKHDFLKGRCKVSYKDNEGMVSFSGENSFSHVYSLLYLSIANNGGESGKVDITGCKFEGEGIATNNKFVFGDDTGTDRMVDAGSAVVSTIDIKYGQTVQLNKKHTLAVLINPVQLDTPLMFTLSYKDGELQKTATIKLEQNFTSGSLYKYNLGWKKGSLSLSGNEVKDWNVVNGDIIFLLEEQEVQP